MKKDTILHTAKGTYVRRLINICSSAYEHMFIGTWTYVTCVLRLFVLLFLQIMGNIKSTSAWRKKSSQCGRSALPLRSSKNKLFPAWESNVPSVGINFSPKAHFLRSLMLLLVMVTAGAVTVWGDDFSGTYYIGVYGNGTTSQCASENPAENFYLCPTEGWCYYDGVSNDKGQITNENNGQPFLTSFKCRNGVYDATKAVWTIEKAPAPNSDYYYIKQASTGKYVVFNKPLNGAGTNRVRVHLETITPPTEPDEYALFAISTVTTEGNRYGYCLFHPKKADSGYYMNITNGNVNSVSTPTGGKTDGPSGYNNAYKKVDGIVGQWNEPNNTSSYKLEPYSPFITFNASNQVEIKAAPSNATLVYTTNESDPTASPLNGTEINTNTGSFDPDDDVTIIKAIAIVNGVESAVATFTPPILLGSSHKRLIQSQNNGWTIDESTTDFHFYMIPGDDVGDDPNKITKVNTTSLFRPTMEWHLLYGGKDDLAGNYLNQYYYIVNSNDKYLCYDGTNKIYMAEYTDDDKFKFKIEKSGSAGSFNIIPYDLRSASGNTARFIYKVNNNGKSDAINIIKDDNSNSRWKFVLPSSLDKTAPFTVSNPSNNSYSYYKIANVGNNDYYIVPGATNATTSNSTDDAVVKTMNWFFEVAQAADASDWLTYFHIRNAVTGNYLYFTQDGNNVGACLEMRSTIESGNEDRYMFTWAKTADTNVNYYIIPKTLKDVSQNQFSALRKHDSNTSIITNVTRDAGRFAWTFSPSSFTCAVPEVTYDGVNDKIILTSPNGADIYYNVNDENDVSISSVTKYTVPIANSSSTQVIKAICARNGDGSDKSDVVTIIFNPTITLSEGASITYDGQAHQPTITSAIFGETTIDESEYELGGYIDESGETVTGCKDAGDYTIVLSNHEGGDYFVYGSTTFTITPATLTVTAEAKEKDYLDPVPELTFITTGLLGTDEQADVLSGALACDVVSDVVGNTYPITQGSLSTISNYTISYTGATLTITAKSIGSGITPATGITIDDITKTGNAFTTPAIKHNDTPLTLGTDYDDPITITGDATTKYYDVTFTGIGNYTGSVTVRYANVNFGTKDNTDYFATFVTNSSGDGDFAKPADITPYIITGVDGDGTTLVAEALDYIPENVPVVLMASSSATNGFSVKIRNGGEDAITDDNKLVAATGTDADRTFGAGEIYILYNGEFVLNASGTLAAGKVYLPKSAITGSAPAPARLLIRRRSGLSSIKDEDFSPLTNPQSNWYTLDGRRLSGKPTRKGLYLQNGQKVVVK